MSSSIDPARVTGDDARQLTPQTRVAWCATCVEGLVNLYSPYFRERFDTGAALSLARDFVHSGEADAAAVQRYLRKCSRLGRHPESYAYGLPNGMLAALAAETVYQTGDSAVECVGFCARMYSNILFFRHGIDDRVPGFRPEHVYTLLSEFNRFSRAVYNHLSTLDSPPTRADCVTNFALDASAFAAPPSLYVNGRHHGGDDISSIPPHEIISLDAERSTSVLSTQARVLG